MLHQKLNFIDFITCTYKNIDAHICVWDTPRKTSMPDLKNRAFSDYTFLFLNGPVLGGTFRENSRSCVYFE